MTDQKKSTKKLSRNSKKQNLNESEVNYLNYSTIRKIHWLWKNRIPLGEVSVIAGDGGTGKSTMVAYICANLSKGKHLEDYQDDGERFDPVYGKALIIGHEESNDTGLLPRLKVAGGKADHVVSYPKHLNLSDEKSCKDLKKYCRRISDLKLIVIDPVVDCMGKVDNNSNSDVSAALLNVSRVAQELQVAVLLITHFKKNSPGINLADRINGSKAYVNKPRVVNCAYEIRNEDGDTEYLFGQVKVNAAPWVDVLKYKIVIERISIEGEMVGFSKIQFTGRETSKLNYLVSDYESILKNKKNFAQYIPDDKVEKAYKAVELRDTDYADAPENQEFTKRLKQLCGKSINEKMVENKINDLFTKKTGPQSKKYLHWKECDCKKCLNKGS